MVVFSKKLSEGIYQIYNLQFQAVAIKSTKNKKSYKRKSSWYLEKGKGTKRNSKTISSYQ
jgi:hypothetical protein